jgi:chromatin-remodeling ATPase INO80
MYTASLWLGFDYLYVDSCKLLLLLLQINVWCSNRNWAYQVTEELHHPWTKKLFLGFARTSEFNGPKEPTKPHYLIQEIDSKLPDCGPILKLPYRIFGSCPPVQNFDPAKMLTV